MKNTLASLLRDMWTEERTPLSLSRSLIVSMFKSGMRNDRDTYDKVSLVSVVNKLSASDNGS